MLEKYAVRMGGGYNHRRHLGEMALIKDNHIVALRALGISLKDIVAGAKTKAPPGVTVEVEATNADEALEGGARVGRISFCSDNMSPDEMCAVKGLLLGRNILEASGGINLANVRQAALAGVDIISIVNAHHSAPVPLT